MTLACLSICSFSLSVFMPKIWILQVLKVLYLLSIELLMALWANWLKRSLQHDPNKNVFQTFKNGVGFVMETITMHEVRELLKSVETIAVRPGNATQRDLILAPALFKKLMEDRTNGVISIQVLVDGKPIVIEAVA